MNIAALLLVFAVLCGTACGRTDLLGIIPNTPCPLRPWNGELTGSVMVPRSLQPVFRWTKSQGVERYNLQVSDACSTPGFASCEFSAPIIDVFVNEPTFVPEAPMSVSFSPPVGRRYYWRVSACSLLGCSPWSPVRYVDVGRLINDFNGDGYADVLVGNPTYHWATPPSDEPNGAAFVFYGSPMGPSSHPEWSVRGAQYGGFFGWSVAAAGDVNADGYADVLVGERFFDGPNDMAGRAYLFLGSASGLASNPAWIGSNRKIRSQFGHDVAPAGDVDGDGFADIAVGSFGAQESTEYSRLDTNEVCFFRGLETGQPTNPSWIVRGSEARAAGDVNGDGMGDVLVGEPWATRLFLFLGSPSGTNSEYAWSKWITHTTGQSFSMNFNTIGDLDQDGFADIVFTAFEASGEGGMIQATELHGGRIDGVSKEPLWGFEMPEPQPPLKSSWLNTPVIAGDFNGDGAPDVVVSGMGVAWEGVVMVFLASRLSLPKVGVPLLKPSIMPMMSSGTFGSSLLVGDYNGDGYDDLVVEMNVGPFLNIAEALFLGSPSGLSSAPAWTVTLEDNL